LSSVYRRTLVEQWLAVHRVVVCFVIIETATLVMMPKDIDLASWLAQLGIDFTIIAQRSPVAVVVGLWLLLELAFWVYSSYYLRPRLNKLQAAQPNHRGGKGLITTIFHVIDKIKDHYPLGAFLTGWFRGAAIDEICEGNVAEYFCWVIFNKHAHEVSKEETDLVDWAVSEDIDSILI